MAFLLTFLFFGKLIVVFKVILSQSYLWCTHVALLMMFLVIVVTFNFIETVYMKHFSACQALDMIRGKNILLLMDSHLEGNFSTEEATVVFDLASQCLQYEPRERPKTQDLVSTLAPLQNKNDASPNVLPLLLKDSKFYA